MEHMRTHRRPVPESHAVCAEMPRLNMQDACICFLLEWFVEVKTPYAVQCHSDALLLLNSSDLEGVCPTLLTNTVSSDLGYKQVAVLVLCEVPSLLRNTCDVRRRRRRKNKFKP
eukprot:scaffold7583_cov16-Tisochrysis_lutea.AAC.1